MSDLQNLADQQEIYAIVSLHAGVRSIRPNLVALRF